MTKETVMSLFRSALTVLGSYVMGKHLWTTPITTAVWDTVIGLSIGVVSVVWSVVTKQVTEEMWQGVTRQVLTFIAGLALTAGVFTNEIYVVILGAIGTLLPAGQAKLARMKAKRLVKKDISPSQLRA